MRRITAVVFVLLLLLVGGCATTRQQLDFDPLASHNGVEPVATHTTSF